MRQPQPATRAELVRVIRDAQRRVHAMLVQMDGHPVRMRDRLSRLAEALDRVLQREPTRR